MGLKKYSPVLNTTYVMIVVGLWRNKSIKILTERVAVSPDGRIWRRAYSITRVDGVVLNFEPKEYKISTDRAGYGIFRKQGVNYKVHRVVAELFLPNPHNHKEVNHKNGIKTDNRVENLEWVSRSENQLHAYSVLNRKRLKKLTDEDVLEIYRLRNSEGLELKVIALMYGIAYQTVSKIAKGVYFITKKEKYNGVSTRLQKGERVSD